MVSRLQWFLKNHTLRNYTNWDDINSMLSIRCDHNFERKKRVKKQDKSVQYLIKLCFINLQKKRLLHKWVDEYVNISDEANPPSG